ncbi:MAG: (4Fe-4S)-binding protein [Lentisphaerae bacterium]|nr:(4Fe-4S)-binding protein [Planctomycetota bacterium]MBM4148099.1 (4Fe-4S)-binding protein [Lentisphaerota bacterium]
MRVAIASGKGGTGKTTIAVNLACVLADSGQTVEYLDCDVEEPNGHIFLKPEITATEPVGIPVPVVDELKCTGCRKCAEVCQYHAIAVLKKPLVFAELCHGCGGCTLVCPEGAIREENRMIGVVETGRALLRSSRLRESTARQAGQAGGVAFVQGRLNVGEPMAPPLIRAVKRMAITDGVAIMDAPPGTSCPVVATVRDADYVLLVTEPTPFGLNDLRLAVEMIRQLGVPHGVVINRADSGDRRVREFCAAEKIPVLQEIPDDRRVAEAYSRGHMAVRVLPEWSERMLRLWGRLEA